MLMTLAGSAVRMKAPPPVPAPPEPVPEVVPPVALAFIVTLPVMVAVPPLVKTKARELP